MTDDPYKIVDAVKIAKKTVKIVKQNITFALFTKFLILFLATFLETSMWAAVFADVGVLILTVFNGMRVFNDKSVTGKK